MTVARARYLRSLGHRYVQPLNVPLLRLHIMWATLRGLSGYYEAGGNPL